MGQYIHNAPSKKKTEGSELEKVKDITGRRREVQCNRDMGVGPGATVCRWTAEVEGSEKMELSQSFEKECHPVHP